MKKIMVIIFASACLGGLVQGLANESTRVEKETGGVILARDLAGRKYIGLFVFIIIGFLAIANSKTDKKDDN